MLELIHLTFRRLIKALNFTIDIRLILQPKARYHYSSQAYWVALERAV